MCSTTLFSFSKGNRLLKIKMNIVKRGMLVRNNRILTCASRNGIGDIDTVWDLKQAAECIVYTPRESYPW